MSVRHSHSFVGRLSDFVLGTDPKMRTPIGLQLLATLLYTSWAALAYFIAIPLKLVPAWYGYALVVHQILVIVTAYPLLRSGRTRGWSDPYLAIAQTLWAGLAVAIGYAVVEPVRPLILQTLCMVQVFGFLSLRPKAARQAGASMIAMLFVMLSAMWVLKPPGFSLAAEAPKIAISSVIIALLAWQSSRFAQLRQQVSADKKALSAALAEVKRIALLDGVTGLPNRQYLQQHLEIEAERASRSGAPFSVALIDLDHFKRVNDTLGHSAGDEVLAGFAKAAREALRETDIVGRWGGEEFVVIWPGTVPGDELDVGLSRLREVLETRELLPNAPSLRVRFSAGVAEAAMGESQTSLMARADSALYEAKSGGRNRTCVAEPA